jgi:hypothetical protein
MRSAFFLPIPGTLVSRRVSPASMVSSRSAASMPDSTVIAARGPMPETWIRSWKSARSPSSRKP